MPYSDSFVLADDVIKHLDQVMVEIADPFISSRYVGFVAVTAVTVYELAIKDILFEFGEKKHQVLGNFTRSYFERMNGRISIDDLRKASKRFGQKYSDQFNKKLDFTEADLLRRKKASAKASYTNILNWRNEFAHGGRIPSTATYLEVTTSYELGKEVIRCLAESMRR